MSQETLQIERAFFDAHLEEWLERAEGRFVLIKGESLIGFFNSMDEALSEGARRFGLTSFLVRQIQRQPGEIVIPALTLGILRANPTSSASSANQK